MTSVGVCSVFFSSSLTWIRKVKLLRLQLPAAVQSVSTPVFFTSKDPYEVPICAKCVIRCSFKDVRVEEIMENKGGGWFIIQSSLSYCTGTAVIYSAAVTDQSPSRTVQFPKYLKHTEA